MQSSEDIFSGIPKPFLDLFPKTLNAIQKESYQIIWNTNNNIILQAPTGSGKTVIAKLAILKGLLIPTRTIYLGPLRALNHEKYRDLKQFSKLNWKVQLVLGGNYSPDISNCDILLSTPEKFLSLLHSLDLKDLNISVLVIDEIHLLGEDKRGAYLEYLLTYVKTFYPDIRLIGLSATIPNTHLLAKWLDANPLIFDKSYRSATQEIKLIDLPTTMKEKFGRIVKSYQISKKFLPNQSIIFTNSRANVYFYAKMFVSWIKRDKLLVQERIHFKNNRLSEMSYYGIAFYHAGLSESDKRLIVEKFESQKIKIIFSTSSLAWGINLPAKAVIIADLEYNNPLKGKELMSSSDILQMLGRAGRPQFHAKGYGYVLVTSEQKVKINRFITGQTPVKSTIRNYLSEILLQFLSHYTRLQKIESISMDIILDLFENSLLITGKFSDLNDLSDIIEYSLNNLGSKLVVYSKDSVEITPIGQLVSKFFINPVTVENFLLRRPEFDDIESIIPLIDEFKEIPVRTSEKKTLRALGATPQTYRSTKLIYVISTLVRNEKLPLEFSEDGKVIYQEYKRILSFYQKLKQEL